MSRLLQNWKGQQNFKDCLPYPSECVVFIYWTMCCFLPVQCDFYEISGNGNVWGKSKTNGEILFNAVFFKMAYYLGTASDKLGLKNENWKIKPVSWG